MASSINKVVLIGNVGKDPEVRHTQAGTKMASFSLATGESWRDKTTGERKDRTEWHRIVVMNEKLAEIIEKYVKKGQKIYVEGQIQTRRYVDSQNTERFTTEIVLSAYRGEVILLEKPNQGQYGQSDESHYSSVNHQSKNSGSHDDLNDDIPF
jgi:single-strand DNA-binding protein